MNIPFNEEGLFTGFFPLKDSNLAAIKLYPVRFFSGEKSDSACIYRIVELFCFSGLKKLSEKLSDYTGFNFPDMKLTPEEVKALSARIEEIIRREQNATAEINSEVMQAEYLMKRSTGSAKTLSEAQSRKKGAVFSERDLKNVQSRLESQKEREKTISALHGLLKCAALRLIPDLSLAFMSAVKVTDSLPDVLRMGDAHSELVFKFSKMAFEDVKNIRSCAEYICNKCSIPSDKFEVGRGGVERAMAYQGYYKKENSFLLYLTTPDLYVSQIMELHEKCKSKDRLFK